MKVITFGDLYAFIEKNARKAMKPNSLELVREFCKVNNLDFQKLKPVLEYFDGFEDFDVLCSVSDYIDGNVCMGKDGMKTEKHDPAWAEQHGAGQ